MKKVLQDLSTLSRKERAGFSVLLSLIMILIVVKFTMRYWVTQPVFQPDPQLLAQVIKQDRNSDEPLPEENIPVTLFTFDPNTLDSEGFRRLGLPARTTKGLMNWRRHGKVFYKKEDFRALYNLTDEEYSRLAPYMVISEVRSEGGGGGYGGYSGNHYQSHYPAYQPPPAVVEVNGASEELLIRLSGIGPATAKKIIAKRNALGGFLRVEQLKEIYPPVQDSVLKHLTVNAGLVKKMGLNSVTADRLALHPYIGERVAKNIILMRDGLKRYSRIDQLRQVPMMNEEIYRKIAPYFTID